MKIYTKTGDSGTTALFGGGRVDKNSARIKAYGEVDELNSLIGVILADEIFTSLRGSGDSRRRSNLSVSHSRLDRESRALDSHFSARGGPAFGGRGNDKISGKNEIENKLLRIQTELFVLGSDLATPYEAKAKIPRVKKSFVTRLEKEIDAWDKNLPILKNFILPGGGKVGAKLHLARTIARRAERSIVDLDRVEKINKNALSYINRLSDWLFVLARYVNKLLEIDEKPWMGRR